jgi:hypothetical protein
MRHLKKYNESVDSKEVSDYIKMVFAEFIDDGSEFESDDGVSAVSNLPFVECSININLPPLQVVNRKLTGHSIGSVSADINFFKQHTEKVLDIYENLEVAINRVKDEYPDIRYRIEKQPDEIYDARILSYIGVIFRQPVITSRDYFK